jgi:hypothetical protein
MSLEQVHSIDSFSNKNDPRNTQVAQLTAETVTPHFPLRLSSLLIYRREKAWRNTPPSPPVPLAKPGFLPVLHPQWSVRACWMQKAV